MFEEGCSPCRVILWMVKYTGQSTTDAVITGLAPETHAKLMP